MYWTGSKYHAIKTVVDGIEFDSKHEALRYVQLRAMQQAGEISGLERQPRFLLIPAQREPDSTGPKGGKKRGRLLERACYYIGDFKYTEDGKTVVEDCKGMKTEVYKIKKKLMLYVHGIRIRET